MTSEDIKALRMIHKKVSLHAMNLKDFSDQLIALETVNAIFYEIAKLAEGKWYEGKEENDEG